MNAQYRESRKNKEIVEKFKYTQSIKLNFSKIQIENMKRKRKKNEQK